MQTTVKKDNNWTPEIKNFETLQNFELAQCSNFTAYENNFLSIFDRF